MPDVAETTMFLKAPLTDAACADPDECGVHGSWNFTCGTSLRRAAARQAEQRAVH